MDSMGGVVPEDSPSVAGPSGPGPVQRKVAGAGQSGATPQPLFNDAAKKADDDEDGPWYKNKEKKKLAIMAAIFLLVFIPFGLPSAAGLIFDSAVENKVKWYVRLQFLFGGGAGDRDNRTKHIIVESLKIQLGAQIPYVVGDVKNTSTEIM